MPHRWDIYQVDLGKPLGHEPAKERPALVVSYDELNLDTPFVAICPITATQRRLYGCEVRLPAGSGITKESIIQVQLVRTIDSMRLRKQLGQLHDPAIRRQVEEALALLFALGSTS
jgi:mRNA interferase MazF